MAKGFSLHIGLNRVDPNSYDNWSGELQGCENDANDMLAIAKALGYESTEILLTDTATSDKVFKAVAMAARTLERGDIFLFTYSGHGGQIPDVSGDESDRLDETWCLYDRMVVDDELYGLWSLFKEGVRIFVISDSCHSGTVTRFRAEAPDVDDNGQPIKYRIVPEDIQDSVYNANATLYDAIQWISGREVERPIKASVILISGCQDNQLSADGFNNGRFTSALLAAWDGGNFQGGYESFWKTIASKMIRTPSQSPNYYKVGTPDPAHEAMKPFVISGSLSRAGDRSSRGAVCYYDDRAYSEGSVVDMSGSSKRCMSDGSWL